MAGRHATRRSFLKGIAGAGLMLASRPAFTAVGSGTARVAAVQMSAKVGDIDANLEDAENWVRFALRQGAELIVLPEFFASGMSNDPEKMLDAHQPVVGSPAQLLVSLAKEGGAFVGGSFLAESGDDVYNTFVLATPSGDTFTHDKDFPSAGVESSFYAGGEDDRFAEELTGYGAATSPTLIRSRPGNIKSGVLPVRENLAVGVALCWEQVRYRTAKRMRGLVDLVLAASAWPIIDPDVGLPDIDNDALRKEMEYWPEMIKKSPRRLARLVGAPVAHANLVGDTWSRSTSDGRTGVLYRFMGESQIVDSRGNVLAHRPYSEGEGLAMADVELGAVEPKEPITQGEFWTPGFTDLCRQWWYEGGAAGREYYLNTTRGHRHKKTTSR